MVFSTFFNLSLNFAMRSSEPQSAPGPVFADWLLMTSPASTAKNISISFRYWSPCAELCLGLLGKGFGMTIVFSWENCQPLPCFIFYSKSKLACYSGYLLIWYFCIPILCDEKDISFFLVLVLEGVVGLHRTGQLQVRHQLLGHRIELL